MNDSIKKSIDYNDPVLGHLSVDEVNDLVDRIYLALGCFNQALKVMNGSGSMGGKAFALTLKEYNESARFINEKTENKYANHYIAQCVCRGLGMPTISYLREIDEHETDLVFRVWSKKIQKEQPLYNVFAVFCHEKGQRSENVGIYDPLGQHSDASHQYVVDNSKLASFDEYKTLIFNLVVDFGYNINLRKRIG